MNKGRIIPSKILKYALKSFQCKGLQQKKQFSACVSRAILKSEIKDTLQHPVKKASLQESLWKSGIQRYYSKSKDTNTAADVGLKHTETGVDVGLLSPEDFVDYLTQNSIQRGFVIFNEKTGKPEASNPALQDLADRLGAGEFEYQNHEAIFFARGSRSNCLLCAFLWKTNRGQGVCIYTNLP